MNEKALCLFAGDHLPELLKCPVRRGVRSDIEVRDSARSYLHDHEDVEQLKLGGDHHKEVTRENDLGMVPNKGHPTLRREPLSGFSIHRSPTTPTTARAIIARSSFRRLEIKPRMAPILKAHPAFVL